MKSNTNHVIIMAGIDVGSGMSTPESTKAVYRCIGGVDVPN